MDTLKTCFKHLCDSRRVWHIIEITCKNDWLLDRLTKLHQLVGLICAHLFETNLGFEVRGDHSELFSTLFLAENAPDAVLRLSFAGSWLYKAMFDFAVLDFLKPIAVVVNRAGPLSAIGKACAFKDWVISKYFLMQVALLQAYHIPLVRPAVVLGQKLLLEKLLAVVPR